MRGIKKEEHPFYGKTKSLLSRSKMSAFRKGKTYEEIFGSEKEKEIKHKQAVAHIGKNNPNYKDIDANEIVCFVDLGYNNNSISKYFNVSRATIWYKFKNKTGITQTEYRKTNGIILIRENVDINEKNIT